MTTSNHLFRTFDVGDNNMSINSLPKPKLIQSTIKQFKSAKLTSHFFDRLILTPYLFGLRREHGANN